MRQDMLNFVPGGAKNILDVGCGDGNFALLAKEVLNAEVWGIEIQPQAGEIAKSKIDKVIIGSFPDVVKELPVNYFDCIVFNDVLEHMPDPWNALERAKTCLSKAGAVVASIPNVRHYSTLYELLVKKDWAYKNSGVLDRTHLRFFTRKSIVRMFGNAGYELIKLEGIGQTKSLKYMVVNCFLMNTMSDAKYLKYVCVAHIKE